MESKHSEQYKLIASKEYFSTTKKQICTTTKALTIGPKYIMAFIKFYKFNFGEKKIEEENIK